MNPLTITNMAIVQDQMSKTQNNEEQYTKLARLTKTTDSMNGKEEETETNPPKQTRQVTW